MNLSRKLIMNDANVIIKLPDYFKDFEYFKQSFQEFTNIFFQKSIQVTKYTNDEFISRWYYNPEDETVEAAFSNGGDDLVMGTIFHSFCIHYDIEMIEIDY